MHALGATRTCKFGPRLEEEICKACLKTVFFDQVPASVPQCGRLGTQASQLEHMPACWKYCCQALDFGEISISLYPPCPKMHESPDLIACNTVVLAASCTRYAVGVPPCEPIVNFMQHTLKMCESYMGLQNTEHTVIKMSFASFSNSSQAAWPRRYLYNAYLKQLGRC